MRNQIYLMGFVAMAGLFPFEGPASAAVEYTLTVLGGGAAQAINNAGQIAGETGSSPAAFLYSNGTLTIFGRSFADLSQGFGINSSGVVVGTADASSVDSKSFARATDGTISFPPLLSAFDINDAGTISGEYLNGQAATASGSNFTLLN